jgi:hypothetical protein
MATAVKYRKVDRGVGLKFVRANQKAGIWVCDAYNHNETGGCPNPECFKYSPDNREAQRRQRKRK